LPVAFKSRTFVIGLRQMKTHVSFQCDSTTLDGEPPFGGDIADALVASLRAEGIDTTHTDSLDYAFFFYAPRKTRRCCVTTGLVEDGVRQWLICVNAERGFISRFFRRADDESVRSVISAIHRHLANDDAISSIRWYDAADWTSRPDDAWTSSPEE